MNALKALYASKTISQKATLTNKTADGRTVTVVLAGRVSDNTDDGFASSVQQHGLKGAVKDAYKDDSDKRRVVSLTGATRADEVALALELLGFEVPAPSPTPEKKPKDKPASAPVS